MKIIYALSALFISVFLLLTGNGLNTTLIPLRAKLEGFDPLIIGLFGAAYFGGMLSGTMMAAKIVQYAGYIRAYAAFVALALTATLGFSLVVDPVLWLCFRATLGFCFAGLYAIIEAWLNSRSTNANRGSIYGLYQNITFAATAAGQGLLFLADAHDNRLFSIAAVMIALATVPLVLTRSEPPEPPRAVTLAIRYLFTVSPIGAMGALAAGLSNGAYWTLAPVYALGIGLKPDTVPWFTSAVVFGSIIGVYPLAILSDRIDRRLMLIGTTFVCLLFDVCLCFFTGARGGLLTFFAVGLGATTMTIYTLAVSQANDRSDPQKAIIVSSGMLFLYCIGAIISPTLAADVMSVYGAGALFGQNALIHGCYVAFVVWRVWRYPTLSAAPHEPIKTQPPHEATAHLN